MSGELSIWLSVDNPSLSLMRPGMTFDRHLVIQRLPLTPERRIQLSPNTTEGLCSHVRTLILILSASRSGSSMLAEALRTLPEFNHLEGEPTPHLNIAGLAYPTSGTGSDLLTEATKPALKTLDRLLTRDIWSEPQFPKTSRDILLFAERLAWRLTVQWPTEAFDFDLIHQWTRSALSQNPSVAGSELHIESFHLNLLREVRLVHPLVNPWYYDLPLRALTTAYGEGIVPQGPPSEVIIEEPPFTLVRPAYPVTREQMAAKPLVIKSPSNIYRLQFFPFLFPNAHIRILHLTRHFDPCVTSMITAWESHAFHAHKMSGILRIRGTKNADRDWWKLELPPGWEITVNSSLEDVCAFQWISTNRRILEVRTRGDLDSFQAKYEDLVSPDRRIQAATHLATWLRLERPERLAEAIKNVPRVMAIRSSSRRLRENWAEDQALSETLRSLGYAR